MSEWKIGDSYKIIENGRFITGVIIDLTKEGYLVEWSDSEKTIEIKIDQHRKKFEVKKSGRV